MKRLPEFIAVIFFIIFWFIVYQALAGPHTTGGGGLSATQNAELLKIDSAAVDGLAGTKNSLAYKVQELEKHFHNTELWYGAAAGDGFLDPAVLTEFRVTASDTGFDGTALQISNGDEIESGSATKYYDMHEILVTATSSASKVQKLCFVYGTGAVGDAVVATEIAMFVPAAGKSAAIPLIMPRITCNNKLWVYAFSETNNATIDFIVGIHTYAG